MHCVWLTAQTQACISIISNISNAGLWSQLTRIPQPSQHSFASSSSTDAVKTSTSYNTNGPTGEHWKAVQQWIVFSDLHVSSKTAKVAVLKSTLIGDHLQILLRPLNTKRENYCVASSFIKSTKHAFEYGCIYFAGLS